MVRCRLARRVWDDDQHGGARAEALVRPGRDGGRRRARDRRSRWLVVGGGGSKTRRVRSERAVCRAPSVGHCHRPRPTPRSDEPDADRCCHRQRAHRSAFNRPRGRLARVAERRHRCQAGAQGPGERRRSCQAASPSSQGGARRIHSLRPGYGTSARRHRACRGGRHRSGRRPHPAVVDPRGARGSTHWREPARRQAAHRASR